jgi:hypothetical protein
MALVSFFLVLAAVVLVAGLLARRRVRGAVDGDRPVVTDEVMRRIVEEGSLPAGDEPLDEDAIREAEERFWEEEWEEPEEWGGSGAGGSGWR